jgi:uncharacterized protein
VSENPNQSGDQPAGYPPAPQYGQPDPGAQHGQPPAPQYGQPAQQYPPQQQYGQPPQPYPPQQQYGQAPGNAQPVAGAPLSDTDRRLWAMLAHLGGIILGVIGPLIVWAIYKDRDEFVKDQATESMNFQITLLIGYVATFVLAFVLPIPLGWLIWVASLVFCILGGLAANKGERYRYPFALRLVS